MKMKLAGIALAVASVLLASCSSPTTSSAPRFTHMDLAISTQERGLPPSAHVRVVIAPGDGETPVASLETSGDLFTPQSSVPLVVRPAGAGFTIGDLEHEQIILKRQGGEGWHYSYDAILHFSDGSEALLSSGSQGQAASMVPLSLASVASSSAVGRMKKFAFGMLSSGQLKSTSDEEVAETAPMTSADGGIQAAPRPASKFFAAPGYTGPKNPKEATFTHMDLSLITRDHGKPADARLEFSIVPDDGSSPVAYLDLQGRGNEPNTNVQEQVPAMGPSFTLAQLKHQRIVVKVTPGSSHVSWSYNFDAILHFTNGSEALLSSGAQVMGAGNAEVSLPLSLASVASASTVGHMERYVFRLLSRGGGPRASTEDAYSVPGGHPGSSPRAFTHMKITFDTHAHGKPAATRLEISIVPDSGEPAVAFVEVKDRDFDAYTTQDVIVPAAGAGFTLDDLKREKVLVKVDGSSMPWSYSFDATLHFADGTQALWNSGDITLGAGRPEALVPLGDAAVAPPSLLGGLKKWGFGILRK
jgi:hypothetical protein